MQAATAEVAKLVKTCSVLTTMTIPARTARHKAKERFCHAFAAAHAATFRGGPEWLTGRLSGEAASGLLWLLGMPHHDPKFLKDLADAEKEAAEVGFFGEQRTLQLGGLLFEKEGWKMRSRLSAITAVFRIFAKPPPDDSEKAAEELKQAENNRRSSIAGLLEVSAEDIARSERLMRGEDETPEEPEVIARVFSWQDPEPEEEDEEDMSPDLCEGLVIDEIEFERALKVMLRSADKETINSVLTACLRGLTTTADDLDRALEEFVRCMNPKRVLELRESVKELRTIVDAELADALENREETYIDFLAFVGGLSSCAAKQGLMLRTRLEGAMTNLTAMFTLIDLGGDGDVDVDDFVKAAELVGLDDPSIDEMSEAILLAAGDEEACLADFVCMCCINPCTITRRFVPRMRYFIDSFALFDEDGEGEISADELGMAIGKLFGWRPTRYEAEKMVKSVDEDGSGIIEFNEFVLMMTITKSPDLVKIKKEIEEVYSMFMMFDLDEAGSLACFEFGFPEFSKVMLSTGHQSTDEELAEMFAAMDEDGEGNVSFAEFTEIITGPSTPLAEVIKLRHTELCSFFSLIDDDGGGSVDFGEMSQILMLLGKNVSEDDEDQLLRAIDIKRDEDVGFDRFVRLMAGGSTSVQKRLTNALAQFREAFLIFDVDGGGTVGEAEFVVAMDNVFGCPDPRIARRMIQEFDKDGNAEIDFAEFVAMMVFTKHEKKAGDFGNVIENPLEQLNSLLKQQLVGYREAFNLFDNDGDGNVTAEDLIRTFKMLGIIVEDNLVHEMVNKADADGSGELQFAEFVLVLSAARNDTGGAVRLDKIAELREMWAYFDQDGSGSITEDEIANVLVDIGMEPASAPAAAHDMMIMVDDGQDGEIEFPEFVRIMCLAMNEDMDNLVQGVKPEEAYGILKQLLGEPVQKKVSEKTEAPLWPGQKKVELSKKEVAKKKKKEVAKIGPMEKRTRELMQMRSDLIKLHMDGETKMARQMEKLLAKLEKTHNESAKEVLIVLRDHLGLELFKRMPETVAIELCCHMGLQLFESASVLLHEGKAVDNYYFVLEGGGLIRKRPTHVEREGGETQQMSMWIDIREPTDLVLECLNKSIAKMPSKEKEGISSQTRQLILKMEEAQLSTSTWFNEAKQYMTNDMDNLFRHPWLVQQGKMHVIYLRQLSAMAPVVRKEYLLVKACTQLSSAPDKRVQLRESGRIVSTLKQLAAGLQRSLEKLEPVFTPGAVVRPFGDQSLPLEAYDHAELGKCVLEIKQHRGFGELIFREEPEEGEEIKSPVSVATKAGIQTVCLTVSRDAYRQAAVIEQAQFLQSIPSFYLVELRELQRLCQHVQKRQMGYGQTFIRGGTAATHVFVVESGSIDVRTHLEDEKCDTEDPQSWKTEGQFTHTKSQSKRAENTHSVAHIGKGDILADFISHDDGSEVYHFDAVCIQNSSVIFQIDRQALAKVWIPQSNQYFEFSKDDSKTEHRLERMRQLRDGHAGAINLLDNDSQQATDALNRVHTILEKAGSGTAPRPKRLPPVMNRGIKGTIERMAREAHPTNEYGMEATHNKLSSKVGASKRHRRGEADKVAMLHKRHHAKHLLASLTKVETKLGRRAHDRRVKALERTQNLALTNHLLSSEEVAQWDACNLNQTYPVSNARSRSVAVIHEKRPSRLALSTAVWENATRCHTAVSPSKPSPSIPQTIQRMQKMGQTTGFGATGASGARPSGHWGKRTDIAAGKTTRKTGFGGDAFDAAASRSSLARIIATGGGPATESACSFPLTCGCMSILEHSIQCPPEPSRVHAPIKNHSTHKDAVREHTRTPKLQMPQSNETWTPYMKRTFKNGAGNFSMCP